MPVTLHPLPHPNQRDRAELERLADEQAGCPAYRRAWQRWLAGATEVEVWVARFNERIIGAVLLEEGVIAGFGVRAATRGRGVGRRMLELLPEVNQCSLAADLNAGARGFIERFRVRPAG